MTALTASDVIDTRLPREVNRITQGLLQVQARTDALLRVMTDGGRIPSPQEVATLTVFINDILIRTAGMQAHVDHITDVDQDDQNKFISTIKEVSARVSQA